jgi:hypothetical protein
MIGTVKLVSSGSGVFSALEVIATEGNWPVINAEKNLLRLLNSDK